MKKVAVVYWSGTGNTEAMADIVKSGIEEAGSQADIFTPDEFTADMVENYDSIAFGCPSMGSEQLEESEFEPMFSEVESKLNGKNIALFGSYGWGDGEWMRTWEDMCKDDGANLVCESVISCGAPDDDAADELKALAKALA